MTRIRAHTVRIVSTAFWLLPLAGCGGDATTPEESSPFEGQWTYNISGDASGTDTGAIQADGKFTFDLDFIVGSAVFPQVIRGSVNKSGDLTATVTYQGSQIGNISGRLAGNTGSGTWQTILAGAGIWTAVRIDPEVVANRPVVIRINFPATIPATAGRTSGTVEFSDPGADVIQAFFDLVSTTGSSFTSFDFDPGVFGRSSGSFEFNIGCNGLCSGTTVLQVTLADALGYHSEPVLFSFSYQ